MIAGRIRIDLSRIPMQHGIVEFGHQHEVTGWLHEVLGADHSSGTAFVINVGSLGIYVVEGFDAPLWAAFARRFDHVLIEGDHAYVVEQWVAALRALAVEGQVAA